MGSSFNGSWVVNLAESRERDSGKQEWIPDSGAREEVRITTDGDVCRVSAVVWSDPVVRLGYTATYDGDWAPYLRRVVEGPDDGGAPDATAGAPFAYVRLIKVSDTFQYRVSRHPDGCTPQYVLSQELTPDDRIKCYVMSPAGVVVLYRVFDRA